MNLKLSKRQMERIAYESMLLRIPVERLYTVAPHLFNENVTASNTVIEEPITKERTSDYDSDYSCF